MSALGTEQLLQPAPARCSNPCRHWIGSQSNDVHQQLRRHRGQRGAARKRAARPSCRRSSTCRAIAASTAACQAGITAAYMLCSRCGGLCRGARAARASHGPARLALLPLPVSRCPSCCRCRPRLSLQPLHQIQACALLSTRRRPAVAPRGCCARRSHRREDPAGMVDQQQGTHSCPESRGPAAVLLPAPRLLLSCQPGEPGGLQGGGGPSVALHTGEGRRLAGMQAAQRHHRLGPWPGKSAPNRAPGPLARHRHRRASRPPPRNTTSHAPPEPPRPSPAGAQPLQPRRAQLEAL